MSCYLWWLWLLRIRPQWTRGSRLLDSKEIAKGRRRLSCPDLRLAIRNVKYTTQDEIINVYPLPVQETRGLVLDYIMWSLDALCGLSLEWLEIVSNQVGADGLRVIHGVRHLTPLMNGARKVVKSWQAFVFSCNCF